MTELLMFEVDVKKRDGGKGTSSGLGFSLELWWPTVPLFLNQATLSFVFVFLIVEDLIENLRETWANFSDWRT